MRIEIISAGGMDWEVEVPETVEEFAEKVHSPELDIPELLRTAYLDKVRQSIRHWIEKTNSKEEVQRKIRRYRYGSLAARFRYRSGRAR